MALYIKCKPITCVITFKSQKWLQEPKLSLEHVPLLLWCVFFQDVLLSLLGPIKSQANALLTANYLWSLINQVEWVAQ